MRDGGRAQQPEPRPRFFMAAALASLVGLALAACASIEGQGVKPAPVDIPAAAPHTLGPDAASAEHKRMISLFGGEYHDARSEHYLNDILVRLANAGDRSSDPL